MMHIVRRVTSLLCFAGFDISREQLKLALVREMSAHVQQRLSGRALHGQRYLHPPFSQKLSQFCEEYALSPDDCGAVLAQPGGATLPITINGRKEKVQLNASVDSAGLATALCIQHSLV